ncbi:MAG: arginine deiminase-related protein [Bacteroidota bacterium]
MIELNVTDEVSPLEAVILGIADSFGGTPTLYNTYDPKSKQHIEAGTFPSQEVVRTEIEAFYAVLKKHHVEVYRPSEINGLNQIFARDIGIVIGDQFIIPNIIKDRAEEIEGVQHLIDQIDPGHRIYAAENVKIEGGDIMPWKGHIFAGYSKSTDFEKYKVARTNEAGIRFLEKQFPDWEIHAFELNKSDSDPMVNALHLDCCFQPLGKGKAIIHKEGFKNQKDYQYLLDFFGEDNCFNISSKEMYEMNSNVFSISPDVVVSDKSFSRLNQWLTANGFNVEGVHYREIAKMEGLFRCSTLPLRRKKSK